MTHHPSHTIRKHRHNHLWGSEQQRDGGVHHSSTHGVRSGFSSRVRGNGLCIPSLQAGPHGYTVLIQTQQESRVFSTALRQCPQSQPCHSPQSLPSVSVLNHGPQALSLVTVLSHSPQSRPSVTLLSQCPQSQPSITTLLSHYSPQSVSSVSVLSQCPQSLPSVSVLIHGPQSLSSVTALRHSP